MNSKAKFPVVLGIVVAVSVALVGLISSRGTQGLLSSPAWAASGTARGAERAATTKAEAAAEWGKLPLRFEANEGQASEGAQFIARGPGYNVLLGGGGATLVLDRASRETLPAFSTPMERLRAAQRRSADRAIVKMEMLGANRAAGAEGLEKLETRTNYFLGNDPSKWHRNVANYGRVRYREIYPGVDLVYYGRESRLEYDLQVAAGRNPEAIRMRFSGAESLRVGRDGALVLGIKGSEIRQLRPRAYQLVGGVERPVEARYTLRGNEVSFKVGAYDHSQELVIDPAIVYSTYFGGNSTEFGFGLAIDGTGNVYLTGSTLSTNLPATSTIGPVSNGAAIEDVFLVKLDPNAHAVVYCDYIGGSNFDEALALAVDGTGAAYLGGDTASNDFPGTAGNAQAAFAGTVGTTTNGWLAKVNAAGSALTFATYLGGGGPDAVNNLTVDGSGNVFATGFTLSSGAKPFPTTAGVFQTAFGGTTGGPGSTGDAFVTKLAAAGTSFTYSTYLGGAADEQGNAISVDGSGNAFVAGETNAQTLTAAFPSPPSAGVIQPGPPAKNAGGSSGWIAEMSATGGLTFFTYLGGNGDDHIQAMTRDSGGNIYVTGRTLSSNFPVMPNPGAAQTTFGGGATFGDAFVTKINGTGTSISYSTYLGGSGDDAASDIRVDANGFAYVVGLTTGSFPVTANATQAAIGGAQNAFVAKLRPDGTQVVFATYHGGNGTDFAGKMALDGSTPPNLYFTGSTTSTNFPATPSSGATAVVQTTNGGGQDAFAVKIDASVPVSDLLPIMLTFGNQVVGTKSAAQMVTYTNNGNAALTIASITISGEYTETDNCGAAPGNTFPNNLAAGASCTINVVFAPTTNPGGTRNGTLTATDNAAGSPHAVALTGTSVTAMATGSLTPAMLAFGNQLVGTKSASQAVTYMNTGNSPLTINSISISGEYTETDNCGTPPSMLAAGASCTINVVFAPTTLPGGAQNGTLTATDTGTSSPEMVTLTGTSTAPAATLAPPSLTFGNQNVGTSSAPMMATLTNTGNSTLNIKSIQLFPAGPSDFSQTNNCGATLAPAASCTFNVVFSPIGGSPGGQMRFGDIQITDDAQPLFPGQTTSSQFLSLQGTGVTPAGGAFTLNAVSNTATIHPGDTATFAILVIPAGGFNQAVALTCTGAPPLGTCGVQPGSVTPNGQNSSPATVIVTTKRRGGMAGPRPEGPGGAPPWALYLLAAMMSALAAGLMRTPVRVRLRYATPLAMAILIVGLTIFAAACNNNGSPGTPTGNYPLTVTGTGGGQTQNLNLNLIVQ